jgi:hypothetical protein
VNGSTDNEIINNILIHERSYRGALDIDGSSLVNLVSDYNIMARVSVDETIYSLDQWQASFSRDGNSRDRSAVETFNSPGSDYRLLPDAFAVDHGATLGMITDDIAGIVRPQGENYDMGCYETEIETSAVPALLPGAVAALVFLLLVLGHMNWSCKLRNNLSQFQNVPFWSISALGSHFNPRNTLCIPPVEMIARLDLDQTETF